MKKKIIYKKNIILFVGIFVLGIIVGYLLSYISFNINSNYMEHTHNMLEVPSNLPIPEIQIELLPDKKKGYNLKINTQNFKFAPENANTENVFGEGHAHLYIDHQKITRLYSNWYYLDTSQLEKGEHEILVTLNSNEHQDLTYNGETIEDKEIIVVE